MNAGLVPQARAHLERVIDFDPDHQWARTTLGYQLVDNEWISPQEIAKAEERAVAQRSSVKKYGRQISKLINKLNSSRVETRDLAVSQLMDLRKQDAVGAVEVALASAAVEPSELAINWMSQIETIEASRVLVKYSLLHPSDEIRQYAIAALTKRPKHDFVPEILGMLSSSISMSIVPTYDRNGAFTGYRQAFAREGFLGKHVVGIDRGFERTGRPNLVWSAPVSPRQQRELEGMVESLVQDQAREEVAERAQIMEQQNRAIVERNERIAAVIAHVSDRPYTTDATRMWGWWDHYNETGYQRYKPERIQSSAWSTDASLPSTPSVSSDCFVAGTPVMTVHGLRKIEEITTGDLVLSKSIATGELGWNPVLRSTFRPPSATVNVSIDGETFCCSASHLFWVSGTGWKKASAVAKGDVLHGAEKPSVVTASSTGEAVRTHNIEVADNANFFVGKNMIMTHDVTPREANRQTVPGQTFLKMLTSSKK